MQRISPAFRAFGAFVLVALAGWLFLARKMRWSLVPLLATSPQPSLTQSPGVSGQPTVIEVGSTVLHRDVSRLGMNLGNQDFYDSQQILKNLLSRNPGFEGGMWQTVIQCANDTPSATCADSGNSGNWPEGFLDGASFEVISGQATGQSGIVRHSSASDTHTGVHLALKNTALAGADIPAKAIGSSSSIVIRKTINGSATDGWAPQVGGGATVTTEFTDLAPHTSGTQAVRMSASRPGQYATLSQYFDSTVGHTYVVMRGPYVINFRAKSIAGNQSLGVKVQRAQPGVEGTLFEKNVRLSNSWQDYSLNFTASESKNALGTAAFTFSASGAEVLLDDVSLAEASPNGTAFRDIVVNTLQRLRPGTLRYMDSGQNFGCTLDNMLAPQFGRRRCGFNRYLTETNDTPIGLHDFLVLSEKLGADPWYTMQIGMSSREAANLMEYLGGPASTKYGALRASLGHPAPWTKSFSTIHLEFGNEAWNTAQAGATIADPTLYADRASNIFTALRSSTWFKDGHFDMVANGQAVNTWLNSQILKRIQNIDSIDIAPYLFGDFADDTSVEHIFGPMFAEPQMIDSSAPGYVHQQANVAATALHPVHLSVYETNMGTVSGTVRQSSIDATIPSMGAGIATIDHMLLMLRDLGITVQNTFQLGGGNYPFTNTAGTANGETTPVWGVVVDMGGSADRVRPSFLAQQLANDAIRSTMLPTTLHGQDPVWNQPRSANGKIELGHVHEIQSFAFADDVTSSLILINLSRNSSHTVRIAGACAPQGTVTVRSLTASNITDSNELAEKVRIATREEGGVVAGTSVFSLPPFSITSLKSANHGCAPTR